jgi:ribosomal protein S18 acetylase RimI-like enzyme
LLAYENESVVGRIDISIIASHFDGSVKAYLDWICVLKSHRHQGIAKMLIENACEKLRKIGVKEIIAIIAHNDDSLRFYNAIPNALIQDQGIWITL